MVACVVGAVTVLLFVWDVSIMRECGSDGNAGVGDGGGVVAVHEYMGGTRSSGIVSSVDDVLEMSVMRGMRGVGGMCMCLARSGR